MQIRGKKTREKRNIVHQKYTTYDKVPMLVFCVYFDWISMAQLKWVSRCFRWNRKSVNVSISLSLSPRLDCMIHVNSFGLIIFKFIRFCWKFPLYEAVTNNDSRAQIKHSCMKKKPVQVFVFFCLLFLMLLLLLRSKKRRRKKTQLYLYTWKRLLFTMHNNT